jgi:hypothetical protein
MASKEEKFLPKYHKTLVMATGDNLEKVKPKIASQWIKEWASELAGPIADREEFRAASERFLTEELGFADNTTVTLEGEELDSKVEGCIVCPGNELLREAGEPTLCPIFSTGLMAINRVLGMRATLLGVDKGGVGFCTIKYGLEEKPASGS